MKAFFARGTVAAVMTLLATAAGLLGKTELAAFLNSAGAADAVVSLIAIVGTLVAGALPGIQKSA